MLSGKFTPSGVWIETGQELVVASLNGGSVGTFTTNYRFEGKYEADFTVEIHGRCQHPITAGSGTGAFAGVTGRLDFKDDVENGDLLPRAPHARPMQSPRSVTTTGRGTPPPHHVHGVANTLTCRIPRRGEVRHPRRGSALGMSGPSRCETAHSPQPGKCDRAVSPNG